MPLAPRDYGSYHSVPIVDQEYDPQGQQKKKHKK